MGYFLFVTISELIASDGAPVRAENSQPISAESLHALVQLIGSMSAAAPSKSGFSPEMLKATAELISSVAWPLALVACVFLFRKQLVQFIGNVETVKVFGAEIKIKQELDKSAKEAAENSEPSLAPSEGELGRSVVVEKLAAGVDISVVARQAEMLSSEYEAVRRSMPPGKSRTREMTVVVAKMRTISRAFYPLRHEFAQSASPGKRLMTIAALGVEPDFEMLDWLGERVASEKPFLQFQALVAINAAIVSPLSKGYLKPLRGVVAKISPLRGGFGGDRSRILLLDRIENTISSIREG